MVIVICSVGYGYKGLGGISDDLGFIGYNDFYGEVV